jgi:hypothetical protein
MNTQKQDFMPQNQTSRQHSVAFIYIFPPPYNAAHNPEMKFSLIPLEMHLAFSNGASFLRQYCEDSYTESLCCDSAFAHKKEFYIFKFPKRFLEIS